MQLKNILCKLFFLIFILFFCNNFAFSSIMNQENKNIFIFNKKNECFSFLRFNNLFSYKKENIVIENKNFIGLFEKNKFKIFYIVKPKDTLYSIAKKSNHNYYELSKFNFIKKPYKIIVGQKIWIGDLFINKNKYSCSIINLNNKNHTSCEIFLKKLLYIKNFVKQNIFYNIQKNKICFSCNEDYIKNSFILKKEPFSAFDSNWYWPIKSTHIRYFYNNTIGNKQIEISGFKKQPIFAAASGEVVYVTDLFKKYGKLIIIKHNFNYLSVYAFNDSVLVKQHDKVSARQQIATMGLSDRNLACLYFEIRYRGESINPLNLLPKINIKK